MLGKTSFVHKSIDCIASIGVEHGNLFRCWWFSYFMPIMKAEAT